MNLDAPILRSTQRINSAFNVDMSGNNTRYRIYLQSPSLNSPYAANDSLATRGGGWSFVRYSLDRVNATDGFVAGNGQVVSGSGSVTASPGAASGDYVAVVLNATLQNTAPLSYSLTTTSASGDVAPVMSDAPAYLRVPLPSGTQPLRDDALESRIRDKERAELTPKIADARAWYAARAASSGIVTPSRSISTSAMTDADGTLLSKLVNGPLSGFANFQTIVGNDMAGFVRDWLVSNAIDDVAALNTQYQQRSWNWHSIYPAVLQSGTYPLPIQSLSVNGAASGTLAAGGAAYYRFTVGAAGSASIALAPPAGGTANPALQLVVVRIR
jgi:hypothetical protein